MRVSRMPTPGYVAAMTSISFRAPGSGVALDVILANKTFKALVGELQIVSPILADKVDHAVGQPRHIVLLQEDEVELLAAAARVVSKSDTLDDSDLERLALL